ncbi:uncharacterized protein LOC144283002 [Canis aureus]
MTVITITIIIDPTSTLKVFFNDHRERRHRQRRVEEQFKPRKALPSVSVCWSPLKRLPADGTAAAPSTICRWRAALTPWSPRRPGSRQGSSSARIFLLSTARFSRGAPCYTSGASHTVIQLQADDLKSIEAEWHSLLVQIQGSTRLIYAFRAQRDTHICSNPTLQAMAGYYPQGDCWAMVTSAKASRPRLRWALAKAGSRVPRRFPPASCPVAPPEIRSCRGRAMSSPAGRVPGAPLPPALCHSSRTPLGSAPDCALALRPSRLGACNSTPSPRLGAMERLPPLQVTPAAPHFC